MVIVSYTQPPAHARSLSSHPENHVYSLSTFDGSALKSSQSSANREPPQQQAASTSGSPPTGAAGLHPQQSPPHMSQSSREGPPITVTGLVTGQGPPQQPQPQPSSSVGQSNGLPGLPGPQGLPGLPGAGAGLNGPAGQQQSGPAAALVAGAAGTMQPAGAQGGPPGNGPGGPILNVGVSFSTPLLLIGFAHTVFLDAAVKCVVGGRVAMCEVASPIKFTLAHVDKALSAPSASRIPLLHRDLCKATACQSCRHVGISSFSFSVFLLPLLHPN